MNRVEIIGNTTKDIEVTKTPNGVSVARFVIAVRRTYKNKENKYDSDFINCIAYRNTAELLEKYVKKGDKLGVSGNIQSRLYTDKNNIKKYITEILVSDIELLTNKKKETEAEDIFGKDMVVYKDELSMELPFE